MKSKDEWMDMAKRKHFQLLFSLPNQRAISTLLAFLLKEGEGDLLVKKCCFRHPAEPFVLIASRRKKVLETKTNGLQVQQSKGHGMLRFSEWCSFKTHLMLFEMQFFRNYSESTGFFS